MATKSDRDIFRTLHDDTAKAIRRGEKFARSLKRVIAQRNPETSLQPLLEVVGKGLATLGAEADELERIGWPKKGADKIRGKSRQRDHSDGRRQDQGGRQDIQSARKEEQVETSGSTAASIGVKRRETGLASLPWMLGLQVRR